MKNVKKLLIFATISTFVFASSTRTDALGGAGFWEDDYANIGSFPASVNGQNVAWTNNNGGFTTIFEKDETTWGFAGGDANDVVNMYWGNGTYGVFLGFGMKPEITAVDDDEETLEVDEYVEGVAASTKLNAAFGMPLAGGDFGASYASGGDININHRRAQEVWLWDTMLINVQMIAEEAGVTEAETNFGVHCYSTTGYDNGATGLFALGFEYGSNDGDVATVDDEATMNLVWNFAVEAPMTDWGTFRIGYTRSHDFGGGENADGVVSMGLGVDYGAFTLDMELNTSGDSGSTLFNDPVHYVTGRNADPLGGAWTISYNW